MYHAHAHGETEIPNGLFGTMYIGDIPAPAGRTISGITIPADLAIAHDVPMVLNDAGVIGLTLNGKSFPATAPLVGEQRRLGQGHLLQRGHAGPPDAPPRLRADRLRQGRRTTRPALRGGHHPHRPRRALHRALPRRPGRHLGLALPHPQPRRSRRPACSAWSRRSSSPERELTSRRAWWHRSPGGWRARWPGGRRARRRRGLVRAAQRRPFAPPRSAATCTPVRRRRRRCGH